VFESLSLLFSYFLFPFLLVPFFAFGFYLFSSLISLLSSPILDSQGGSGAKRPSFFCCSCTSQWWHPSVSTSLPPTCYSPVPCSELVGSLTPTTLSSSMHEKWTTHCSVRSVLESELCTSMSPLLVLGCSICGRLPYARFVDYYLAVSGISQDSSIIRN